MGNSHCPSQQPVQQPQPTQRINDNMSNASEKYLQSQLSQTSQAQSVLPVSMQPQAQSC